jgi:hypothetical protein
VLVGMMVSAKGQKMRHLGRSGTVRYHRVEYPTYFYVASVISNYKSVPEQSNEKRISERTDETHE